MTDIVVTAPAPINLTVTTDQTNVTVQQQDAPTITVENGFSTQNLFVGADQPTMTSPGMWIQTFENGDWTIWIEDGT